MTGQQIYRIYKITNTEDDMIYIGSTKASLKNKIQYGLKRNEKEIVFV